MIILHAGYNEGFLPNNAEDVSRPIASVTITTGK